MAFATGRFGVQYHPRGSEEPHLLRWLVAVVVVAVLIAFACFRIQKYLRDRQSVEIGTIGSRPESADVHAKSVSSVPGTNATPKTTVSAPRPLPPHAPAGRPESKPAPSAPTAPKQPAVTKSAPPPQPELSAAARNLIEKIAQTIEARPAADQSQLRRLIDAERAGKPELAIDAIRRLYARPTLADLRDPLMRRWGDLNLALLLSGKPTTWTTQATVRRGDGLERIAREHNTTPAAVRLLNPKVKWERLKPGDTVRVLAFPSATLVVYADHADLSLNKNVPFFRRYYLSISKKTPNGVYAIESGHSVAARFRELGLRFATADRAELEMFLAPGSRIVVSSGQ